MAFVCSPNSSETPSFAWLPIWRLNGAFLVLLLITSTWPVKWRGLGDDPKWRPLIMINLTSPPTVAGSGTSDATLITGVDGEGISAHEQRNQRAKQTEDSGWCWWGNSLLNMPNSCSQLLNGSEGEEKLNIISWMAFPDNGCISWSSGDKLHSIHWYLFSSC